MNFNTVNTNTLYVCRVRNLLCYELTPWSRCCSCPSYPSSSWCSPLHPMPLRSIFNNILFLYTCVFPSCFLNNIFNFYIVPIHATCPTHLILPHLATPIFVEGYNLCSFSHPPVTFFFVSEKVTYIILLYCFMLLTPWSQNWVPTLICKRLGI